MPPADSTPDSPPTKTRSLLKTRRPPYAHPTELHGNIRRNSGPTRRSLHDNASCACGFWVRPLGRPNALNAVWVAGERGFEGC
jgi:hypothetical protein